MARNGQHEGRSFQGVTPVFVFLFLFWSALVPASLHPPSCLADPGQTEPEDATPWHVGEALARQLDAPAGVTWRGLELRNAVQRLSSVQRVGIFLDRRLDPNQPLDLVTPDTTLRETLHLLGRATAAHPVQIGPVVYLAPRDEADRLATTAAIRRQRVQRSLPAEARRRWSEARPWNWPRLSTPAELLDGLAREGKFRLVETDRVPHDLWPEQQLPPMTLSDRLSLVLAGFGLTYEVSGDGGSVRIVPQPDRARLRETYTVEREAEKLVARLRRQSPTARAQVDGTRVTLDGTWSDQDQFRRWLRELSPATRPGSAPGGQLYTLRVKNQTLGAVAKALADRLGRQLEVDRRANPSLRELVSFEVRDATLDELLHAVFDPTKLQFELDKERLRVFP